VLHGWQNRRPQEHWQWQLVEALRCAGEQVLYQPRPDAAAIAAAAGSTRLVCSNDDPYCPETAPVAYADLAVDTDIIPGGQHLDPDAGYGAWPSAIAWCLDPMVRLLAR